MAKDKRSLAEKRRAIAKRVQQKLVDNGEAATLKKANAGSRAAAQKLRDSGEATNMGEAHTLNAA